MIKTTTGLSEVIACKLLLLFSHLLRLPADTAARSANIIYDY
jgi:hypothetical protein